MYGPFPGERRASASKDCLSLSFPAERRVSVARGRESRCRVRARIRTLNPLPSLRLCRVAASASLAGDDSKVCPNLSRLTPRLGQKTILSSPSRDLSRGKGTQVPKTYAVYMVASRRNGTLYTGVTGDLLSRIWQHRNNTADGFTKKYSVHRLVWYEFHREIHAAIARERKIKGWNRAWKIRLIEKENSAWNDLFVRIAG